MAFLALASQKSLLTLQKNFLQFQQVGIQNQIQLASAQMSAIQKEYRGCSSDEGYQDDADYIYYEQLDEQLQTEKDLLDSQITELDSQISSMKTLVQNNIKSSCTLNLSGGN